MNLVIKKRIFWTAVITFFFICIYSVSGILFPFVAGIMLAYFLDPAADKLEAKGIKRTWATLIILSVFIILFTVFILAVSPLLYDQLKSLITNLPEYTRKIQREYGTRTTALLHKFDPNIEDRIQAIFAEQGERVFEISKNLLGSVLVGGAVFFNAVTLIFITPIVTFYFLRDWDVMIAKIDEMLPRDSITTIRMLAKRIDDIISAYLRGQITVCVLLGIFYAIGLTLTGLNYGFVIGLLTGIFSFVPYVGMIVGTTIGLLVGYFQFGFGYEILAVLAVFVIGNVIEGNFIAPKIVGDKVNLHAVWIMFALLAGGKLLGLTGVILAIPVAAVIGVLVRYFIEEYKESNYFK